MPDPTQTVVELLSAALTPQSLESRLDDLVETLVSAVPSFLGFNVHTGDFSFSWGPGLTVPPGEPIHAASTLRWVVAEATTERVELVLFAGRPGAWVDLSADILWLTKCPPHRLVLDQDLTATVPIVGADLVGASGVNQAIGALVACGYSVQGATNELDARARVASSDRASAAAALLDGLPRRAPEPA